MSFADVPTEVKNSSNAQWEWELKLRSMGRPGYIGIHAKGLMAQLFENSRTWLHRDQTPVHAYWLARHCSYEIHLSKNQVRRGVLEVAPPRGVAGSTATTAIGYTRSVDALELVFRSNTLDTIPTMEDITRQEMMVAYFRYRASESPLLRACASYFSIGNLCTSTIGMLVATALRHRINLEKAWDLIPDKAKAAGKVMRSILSVDGNDSDNRRLTELKELWENPAVHAEIASLVTMLWNPPKDEFDRWLRRRFIETIRAAIEEATRAVLPEASDSALRVETVSEEKTTSIWILEADPGGVGVIERLLRAITSDPEQFEKAFEWSLSVCPAEETRTTVIGAVRAARDPYAELRGAFNDVRNATDYRALEDARKSMITAMERQDLPASKRHITALLSKALGPGSNTETERWLLALTGLRKRFAARICTAVDARSFAYWLTTEASVRTRMQTTLRGIFKADPDETQTYQAFMRLTLEPCSDSCPECLGIDGETQGLSPSRRLAALWLGPNSIHTIYVGDEPNWIVSLLQALSIHARIRLRYRADKRNQVAENIATLLTSEIDRGSHSSPLRIVGIQRRTGWWETDVEVDPWEGH
jgi:hypothetical protein